MLSVCSSQALHGAGTPDTEGVEAKLRAAAPALAHCLLLGVCLAQGEC